MAGTPEEKMHEIASRFAERINGVDIDAINIPEVRDERRRTHTTRTFPYLPTTPPREYARLLAALTRKEPIINQVVVHYQRESYVAWLRETWGEYGIRNLVLVGGDSSRTVYPGPSVLEAAALIKRSSFEYLLGGITIPERHKHRGDEVTRNLQKIEAGLQFFTSQVIYDPDATVGLVDAYARECERRNVAPARVFLSFAPFSTEQGAGFLRWLGVTIPSHTLSTVLRSSRSAQASAAICTENLRRILDAARARNWQVPLGINVENVSKRKMDIETSIEMVGVLSEVLRGTLR